MCVCVCLGQAPNRNTDKRQCPQPSSSKSREGKQKCAVSKQIKAQIDAATDDDDSGQMLRGKETGQHRWNINSLFKVAQTRKKAEERRTKSLPKDGAHQCVCLSVYLTSANQRQKRVLKRKKKKRKGEAPMKAAHQNQRHIHRRAHGVLRFSD